MFYSKIAGLFYPAAYPAEDLPEDSVELSDAEYAALLSAKFYSASTSGFYSIEVHGNKIPTDAVQITDAEYRALLDGQSSGLMISSDAQGRPILVERPPPTPAQVEAKKRGELLVVTQLAANQKSALVNRIGIINDAVEFGEATEAEVAELPQRKTQLDVWKRYAVALSRVTSQTGWYETIAWPAQPTEGMDLGIDPVGRTS